MLKKQYNKNEPTTIEPKDLLSGQLRVVYFLPVFTDRFRVVCRKYPFPLCYTKKKRHARDKIDKDEFDSKKKDRLG
jgi:hypothetical protein